LDEEFSAFAKKRAQEFASQADWEKPDLPPSADVAAITQWLESHPNNYFALERQAAALVETEQWDAAAKVLARMLELYPHDERAYARLVSVYRQQGAREKELAALEKWSAVSCDAVPAFVRLLELHGADQNWEGVKRAAQRLLASNPLLPAPHRALAAAAEATQDQELAIASLTTMLRMSPLDEVELHFRLARLLQTKGELAAAKRHVLLALEEAPRFREGHKKYLEIVRELEKLQRPAPAPDTPPETPGR
jgi:tetratricopeptide (TPR) repeat protein